LELGERAARVRGEPDSGCTVWRRPARATIVKEAGSGSRAAGVEVTTIPNRWWWLVWRRPARAGAEAKKGWRRCADGIEKGWRRAGTVTGDGHSEQWVGVGVWSNLSEWVRVGTHA
jgi:hypothetical protein